MADVASMGVYGLPSLETSFSKPDVSGYPRPAQQLNSPGVPVGARQQALGTGDSDLHHDLASFNARLGTWNGRDRPSGGSLSRPLADPTAPPTLTTPTPAPVTAHTTEPLSTASASSLSGSDPRSVNTVSRTIAFEGFPETPPEKSGKLKFSEIPTRSKLTLMVISVANFGAGCAFSLPAPFFPREASMKGASTTMVGIVFSCYELVNFIMMPIWGNFVAEIGAKFLYTAGITVTGCCSLLFGFLDQGTDGTSFILMSLLVRSIEALGNSAFSTASFAIISAEFPNHISSVFAVLEAFIGIGLMVGPTIGGSLYEVGGFGLPFWVTGVLIMSSGILFFGCLPPPLHNKHRRQGNILTLLRSPIVWVAMSLIIAGASSIAFLDPTLALHLDQFGLSTIEVSLFFVISPLLYVLTAPLCGYLADTRDIHAAMMMWACLACGVGFLMVGPTPLLPFLPKQIWFITLGLVTWGVGVGCTIIPTMKCIVIGARELGFPDDISTFGMVSGLFNANFHLGAFVGPTIAGALMEQIGFEYSATVISAIFTVGFFVVSGFFGFRRWRRSRGSNPYSTLLGASRNQYGGINFSTDQARQKQNLPLATGETTPLLENDGKTSVSCQTPQAGRFLQSSTFSSSGHMSW